MKKGKHIQTDANIVRFKNKYGNKVNGLKKTQLGPERVFWGSINRTFSVTSSWQRLIKIWPGDAEFSMSGRVLLPFAQVMHTMN